MSQGARNPAKGRRSLPMLKGPIKPEHCRRCARIAPWFSFWGNLALATHKLVVGILGRSTALVADAIHSFGDVIGSASILIATNSSGKKPDDKFPYGRGKAEFISAVFVYVMLLFLATGIMISALRSIRCCFCLAPAVDQPDREAPAPGRAGPRALPDDAAA